MTKRGADEVESAWRRRVLKLVRRLGDTPKARRAVAEGLGVTERTIRRWADREKKGEPLVKRPGRPADPVDRAKRQQLIATMIDLGPCAGVPVLRGLFRDVPYRTIARMKRRLWRAYRRRRGWYLRRLRWLRAGATWATDFTHPKAVLPEDDRRLCLVRDLGSGLQLASARCRGERARVAYAVLSALFLLFGAPLALKHDGGGAFIARDTQTLLGDHGVTSVRSPPRRPQYNGACERGIGTYKQRVEHLALAAGHPGRWTDDDLAAALAQANHTARPFGANGPTPAEAFAARTPVTDAERGAFQRTLAATAEIALETHTEEFGRMPTCRERATINRKAAEAALCEHGYLQFRRGRLSTPISTWKTDAKA